MAASSSSPQYTVFISHAGEDKATIAVPLREKLRSHGITAFVDEMDMRPGTDAPAAMTTAMETAKIAVIVLSPEFIARRWPMRELLCFVRRRDASGNDPLPVIIPLFYRLSIPELYSEPRFDRVNSDDEKLYDTSRFFERRDAGEIEANPDIIKDSLLKVCAITGVRNDLDATNHSSYITFKKRELLLQELCEAVIKASLERRVDSNEFRSYHYKAPNTSELVLCFYEEDQNGYADTQEGEILKLVEDMSPDASRVIAVNGMGGVGKTSVLLALSELERIKHIYEDGVHLIRLGMNAKEAQMISALSTAVKNSGGQQKALEILAEEDWRDVIETFRSWFAEKRCLFLVDDVRANKITSAMIHELLSLHNSGRDSKVMVTTRSLDIAARADESLCLEPRMPLDSVARAILIRYAGIEPKMDDSDERKVVKEILERCCGLPLFLAIAGRAVRKLKRTRKGCKGTLAYHVYAKRLEANMQGLLNADVDSYERLQLTLSLSISLIEREMNALGFSVSLAMAVMHRRLSVLEKQERVPMSMLRYLWELRNEAEAAIVAEKFEEMALVNIEMELDECGHKEVVSLHDSLHLFASNETAKYKEEKVTNEVLLNGYSESLDSEEGLLIWWSPKLQDDGYMPKRVCKHLLGAGRCSELIRLLLRPQWAERQLKVSGTRSLNGDFSIGIKAAHDGTVDNTEEERSEMAEVLQLISDAVKLSSPFISKNHAEVCFQLHGRLKRYANRHGAIQEYVGWMEAEGPRPGVLSVNDFLGGPGGACTKIISTGAVLCSMVVLSDGPRVACGTSNGFIYIVNIHESDIEKTWKGHSEAVWAIAVGGNGTRLVTGSEDGTVKLWDAGTGHCVASFDGHTATVRDVALMKDENRVISVSEDGTPQVWETDTGRVVLPSVSGHEGRVSRVVVLEDRDEFITGGTDGTLRMWSGTTGKQAVHPFGYHAGNIFCVEVTADQRHVVSGSGDGTIKIWDVDSHEKLIADLFVGSPVYSAAVYREGSRIVSGSLDGKIRMWDSQSGTQLGDTLQGHGRAVFGVSFLGNADSIVSCSLDGTVRVWDARRRTAKQVSDRHNDPIYGVSFTPDGKTVVSASQDKTLRIWEPRTGQQLAGPLTGHFGPVYDAAVTPNGRCVVSVSSDKTVGLWDLESRQLLCSLKGHKDDILCVAVMPDGSQAVTGSFDKTVRIWDLSASDGSHVILEGHSADVGSVFVTDDGLRIVSVDFDDEICAWDLKMHKVERRLQKEDAQRLSRVEVLNLVGETTLQDIAGISIPLGYREIVYGEGPDTRVLATLESPVYSWDLSPDKKTICLGLLDGHVAFLKFQT